MSAGTSSSVPPPRRTGAVRADEPRRRRRGLLWLLLALLGLALIALAAALYLGLRGEDDPQSRDDGAQASSATTSPTGASGSLAPTAAGALRDPGGLVGGAGVTPAEAAGVPDGSRLVSAGTVGTVLFAEDSAAIDSAGQQVVRAAAQQIQAGDVRQVQVTGYTDVVGGQPVNSSLSQQRADAVAAALRAQLGAGIPVTTAARGQADPVVPNDTDAHRQLNRRATITVR